MAWRLCGYWLSVGLAVAQLLLIVLSWLLSAARPSQSIHSLLSERGIRWFFGYFVTSEMAAPLLWLVLGGLTVGAVGSSGVLGSIKCLCRNGFSALGRRERMAFCTSMAFLAIQVICVILMVAPPHAVLLSVTGTLANSSFSASIVPMVCFMLTTSSIVYGLLSGKIRGVLGIGDALCSASTGLTPLLLLYILGSMFVNSFIYVFFAQ